MVTKMRLSRIPAYLLGVITLSLVLTANSFAADFYVVKLAKVNPRAAGDVFVQFDPGASETRFTARARGLLVGADPGSNKIMAVFLTAITLGSEISLLLDNVPTFSEVQVINSANLIITP